MKPTLLALRRNNVLHLILVLLTFQCVPLFSQQLDPDFGTAGTVTTPFDDNEAYITAITVQPDGKILALGEAYRNEESSFAMARYLPNGTLDTGFGTQGKLLFGTAGVEGNASDIALGAAGDIYVAGQVEDAENHFLAVLAHFNSDGSPDQDFGNSGLGLAITTFGTVQSALSVSVLVQPDEKVLIAGASFNPDDQGDIGQLNIGIARFESDGRLDESFGTGGSVTVESESNNAILDLKLQPDGKIVASGIAQDPDQNNEDVLLMRFNGDGSLDSSFGTNGTVLTSIVSFDEPADLVLQADGKILVAGYTLNPDANSDFFTLRYTSEGVLDPAFGTGGIATADFDGSEDNATAIRVQTDGKIVVSGHSESTLAVVRFLADGTPDPAFGTDGKFKSAVQATSSDAELTADGKMLIAGDLVSDDGFEDNFFLAQFNLDDILGIASAQNDVFSIYPNPVVDFIHIDHPQEFQKMDATVYDLLGKMILSENLSSEKTDLDLSDLNPGIYILNLQMDNMNFTKKIIKK